MSRLPVVADFMDKSFATLTPETSMNRAIELLVKKKATGLLVVEGDKQLAGILSEKDCLKILVRHGFDRLPDETVGAYMHDVPTTIPSRTDIIRAAQIFLDNPFRRLAVVDDGKLVGQITRRDIVKGMQKYFKDVE